jgi:hypothetical protein
MADNFVTGRYRHVTQLPASVLPSASLRLTTSVSTINSHCTLETYNGEAFGNLRSPLKGTKALLSRKALAGSRNCLASVFCTDPFRPVDLGAQNVFCTLSPWMAWKTASLDPFSYQLLIFTLSPVCNAATAREMERNGMRGLRLSHLPSQCVYKASSHSILLANTSIFVFCLRAAWRLRRSTVFARCGVYSGATCGQITTQLLSPIAPCAW